MLYLLHPCQPLQWCDMPHGTTDYIKPDTDVSGFGWQPAEERAMTDALVALALRYGHAVPLGLVVDGVSVSNVDRAEKLLALMAESQEIHAKLRDSDAYKLLDQLMPGHAEETARLDREVDASMLESVKEARADLAEDLSAPIKADVAEHWQRLGGHMTLTGASD